MHCATEDEERLIQALGAARYAQADLLCSTSCRGPLLWLDWEVQTAKSFYALLRHLETGMRTAMSGRLVDHFGRRDWWLASGLRLTHLTLKKIHSAEESLRQAHGALAAENIEALFDFGLWVGLLGRGANYESQFWRPVRAGFPAFIGSRKQLWSQVNHLRILRNKVAHHEPIGARHLERDRASALECIGYLSPSLAEWARDATPDLPDLIRRRPGRCPGPRRPQE